jgi:YidC/Oxa1 family membrane protein insertase
MDNSGSYNGIKENDINPFRSMLGPLVQTPVFLSFFFGLRKMAETVPSFKTGGTSWFEDLSKPDPLFLMPTLCAGIFLLNLQLSLTTGASPTNKQWINVFRLFGLSIIPLTAKMPCAIFCYWIPSNLFSFLQNLVFSITSVRALLRLPPLPYKRNAAHNEADSDALQNASVQKTDSSHPSSSSTAQNTAASMTGTKAHLKLYDKAPRHRNFSILLYRQQSQLWTRCK